MLIKKNIILIILTLLLMRSLSSNDFDKIKINKEPKEIPAFTFYDLKNNEFTLMSFLGNKIVLNLWATWCAPCIKEMPSLNNLSKIVKKENIKVITLNQDQVKEISEIKRFYKDNKLAYLKPYLDNLNNAAKATKIRGLPTTLIINEKGEEIARVEGIIEWDSKKFLNWIRN